MGECFEAVIKFLESKRITMSIDNYFDCIAIIYSYSLSDEPRKLDHKFVKWIIENKNEDLS